MTVATTWAQVPAFAQVAPVVTIDPASGPAGWSATVSGSGFGGNCGVRIWFGGPGTGTALDSAFIDEFGSFSLTIQIPADASAGVHPIVAQGLGFATESDGCGPPTETRAETEFSVTGGTELVPRFVPEKPVHTEVTDNVSHTESHLKFVQGSQVRLDDGEFITLGSDDLSGLQLVLAAFPAVEVQRLFSARSEGELAREKARIEGKSGREQGDKNLYFLLTYPQSTDSEALLDQLNALAIVEIAYPVPLPGEDPVTPDFRPNQAYRHSAPGGIHADAAMTVSGGRGSNVQITDIERYFNPDHEDLPAVTEYDNGDALATFTAPFDHGTAVLGEIFGVDNGIGVLGIADQAAAAFVTSAGGRANAIDVATANSDAGDVILLELQVAGPNGECSNSTIPPQFGCVPEEYVQASYDAIVSAVDDGIIVVAAAGNGFQDLDSDDYDDTLGMRPDSGAIIVGAGNAPGCTSPPRGRKDFSNYGSRVNLQGYGECVATTGYGGLQGASDGDDAYTGGFSGTSSATPIVAGAAGVVSSVAIENGDADGLSSTEARALLVATGTPQDVSAAALDGLIGPLPNLAAALGLEADLSVAKTESVDPAVAGEELSYTLTVTNDGPNVAFDVVLSDTLPAEVDFASADAPCVFDGAATVSCALGVILPGDSVEVEITVDVPPDLVFDSGGPLDITNSASVTSSIDDPSLANNDHSIDTTVVAEGDLEVVSVVAAGAPGEALIGDDIVVTVSTTVRNGGPSTPMDADLDTEATPSAGASASPASESSGVAALTAVQQVIDQDFTVSCEAPGPQEVKFDVEISPSSPFDSDPNLANNTGEVTISIECILPIAINIRPANKFNQINVGSNAVVQVAALTTEAGEYGLPLAFDATTIVAGTVRFGAPAAVFAGTGGSAVHNGIVHVLDSFELDDKTKDGDDDLRMGFRTSEMGLVVGDSLACMRGKYVDGGNVYSFFGCDFVDTK